MFHEFSGGVKDPGVNIIKYLVLLMTYMTSHRKQNGIGESRAILQPDAYSRRQHTLTEVIQP